MIPEQEKLRTLLTETVTLLCRSGITFQTEVRIQGLLAITVDVENFFVVQIDEVLRDNDDFTTENIAESTGHLEQPNEEFGLLKPKTEEIAGDSFETSRKRKRLQATGGQKQQRSGSKVLKQKTSPGAQLDVKEFPDLFASADLMPVAAQIKVEFDGGLVLTDSMRNSNVRENTCYGNENYSGVGATDKLKRFEDRHLMAVAAGGPASSEGRSGLGRQRQKPVHPKHLRQHGDGYGEAVRWTYQSDTQDYGLTDDMQNVDAGQGITEISDDSSSAWNAGVIKEEFANEELEESGGDGEGEGAVFTCEYDDCDKVFYHKRSLVRHQRKVHGCIYGADREVTFFCRVNGCRATFRSLMSLSRHRSKFHDLIQT